MFWGPTKDNTVISRLGDCDDTTMDKLGLVKMEKALKSIENNRIKKISNEKEDTFYL